MVVNKGGSSFLSGEGKEIRVLDLELRVNSWLTCTLSAPKTFQLGQVVGTAELVRARKNQHHVPIDYVFFPSQGTCQKHVSLPGTFFPSLDLRLMAFTHHS